MASFFEKLKEAQRINLSERSNYGEHNLPNMNYGKNAAAWRDRQAVPFSFKKSENGDRQYGIMYVPYYEKDKFGKDGGVKASEIETYGGELIDGLSYNTQGLRDLFANVKDADFRIEGGEMVKMDDAPKFRDLLTTLRSRQNATMSKPTFYQNYKNSIGGMGL